MALSSTTRGYKGRGRFTLRPLSGGGRPFELGNVVSLTESIEVDRSGRQNYQDAGGGELDVEETITSVTFEATANDISPRNIALAMRGTANHLASEVVSSEDVQAWPTLRIAFRYLPDPAVDPTASIKVSGAHAVTTVYAKGAIVSNTTHAYYATEGGTSAGTAPTFPTNLTTVTDGTVTWKHIGTILLVAETDYDVTPHGIRMLTAATTRFIDDATTLPLTVGYERNPQYLIQALTDAGTEYEIIWHGLNAVDSGNPITARYFRVKFSPTSGFSRHGGDDFAELTLSGTVLADQTREGTGLSQFIETAMI